MDGRRYTRSRTPNGKVANANWNKANEKFYANWNNGDNRNPNAGGREEVSPFKRAVGLFYGLGNEPIHPFIIFDISWRYS